jgi:hypothetical protein
MGSGTGGFKSKAYRPIWGALFKLLAGPLVWALHLAVVYNVHATLCARGFPASVPVFVVGAATVAALAVLMLCLRHLRRGLPNDAASERSFRDGVSMALVGLSLIGIAWAGATIAIVPGCLALR